MPDEAPLQRRQQWRSGRWRRPADDAELRAEVELDLRYYTVNVGDFQAPYSMLGARLPPPNVPGDPACSRMRYRRRHHGGVRRRAAASTRIACAERAHRRTPIATGPGRILRPSSTARYCCTRAPRAGAHYPQQAARETFDRGEESHVPFSCFFLAWVCVWRGDLVAAGRLADEARQTAAVLDDPAAHGIALAAGALVHALDGSIVLARQEALGSIRLFQELDWAMDIVWPLWALGLAEMSTENPTAVDAALGPLATMLTALGGGDPFLGVFLPEEIEALVELGHLDRAELLIERLEGCGRGRSRMGAGCCRSLPRAVGFQQKMERRELLFLGNWRTWPFLPRIISRFRMRRSSNSNPVLTIVGGKIVYATEEFSKLAPPALPVSPSWSPVKEYGGYAKGQPQVVGASHSASCSHIENSAASRTKSHLRVLGDLGLWGLGCDCFAF